jgi:isoleucyl-tRNA synthetase
VPAVDADDAKWTKLRELRERVTEAIEPLRRDKIVGSSLEAEVTVPFTDTDVDVSFAELFIVSSVSLGDALSVMRTANHKCGRCWRYLPEVKSDGDLCARCEDVLNG